MQHYKAQSDNKLVEAPIAFRYDTTIQNSILTSKFTMIESGMCWLLRPPTHLSDRVSKRRTEFSQDNMACHAPALSLTLSYMLLSSLSAARTPDVDTGRVQSVCDRATVLRVILEAMLGVLIDSRN